MLYSKRAKEVKGNKMRRWRRPLSWFSKAVLVLNCIAVIILLFSYLAPFINPAFFWPIAFVGIAYPIVLLTNLIFIGYWLFRKPKLSLISIFFLLIGWNTIKTTVGFTKVNPTTQKDSASIRVMSYNVHLFRGYGEDKEKNTKAEILQIVKDIEPDVICMQEFYTRRKGKNDVRKSFIKELGYKHHYFKEVAGNDFDAYGIAIFSKYPIVQSGSLDINLEQKSVNRVQFADIKTNDRLIRVYNVHLQSIGFQKEDYEFIARKPTNIDEDISSTRRIGGRLKNAFIKRSKQAKILADHIEGCETPYIVAGDFNDTPTSYSVNKISKGMNNAFAMKGTGWGVTYNGDFPNFQIDYVMASKEFNIQSFQIIREKLSDHYPIWSDLTL